MTESLKEFLSLSTELQKKWLQTDVGEQFQTCLVEYPIVAMCVDMDDIFKERTNNFSDYDHGLFFHGRTITEERYNYTTDCSIVKNILHQGIGFHIKY